MFDKFWKMKNRLPFLILLLLFYSGFMKAQYNPIQNLSWSHGYDYPHNCFSLSWTAPELSNDSLIGYNIYRNDSLYLFTSETAFVCNPCIGMPETDFCNFIWFNIDEGFTICVKAVYEGNIESE